MNIRRWFSELRDPARKCARLGHVITSLGEWVYLYPTDDPHAYCYVADSALEVTRKCQRCGRVESVELHDREGISSLTMAPHRWRLLKRDGRLVVR